MYCTICIMVVLNGVHYKQKTTGINKPLNQEQPYGSHATNRKVSECDSLFFRSPCRCQEMIRDAVHILRRPRCHANNQPCLESLPYPIEHPHELFFCLLLATTSTTYHIPFSCQRSLLLVELQEFLRQAPLCYNPPCIASQDDTAQDACHRRS